MHGETVQYFESQKRTGQYYILSTFDILQYKFYFVCDR